MDSKREPTSTPIVASEAIAVARSKMLCSLRASTTSGQFVWTRSIDAPMVEAICSGVKNEAVGAVVGRAVGESQAASVGASICQDHASQDCAVIKPLPSSP